MAESSVGFPLLKVHTISARKPLANEDVNIPSERSGHRIVATDNCIYAIGGYNPDYTELFDEVWCFNVATRTWTKLNTKGSQPKQVASHSMCLYGDNIVTFGGSGLPFGLNSSNDVHLLNLKDGQWQRIHCEALDNNANNLPSKRYGHTMHIINHHLYICGGTQGIDYMLDLYRLDLKTKSWEHIACRNPPEERYRHETVCDGKKMYMFGGGAANSVFDLIKIPVLDLKTFCWSYIQSVHDDAKGYPLSRKYHGCIHYKDDVYISGGMHPTAILKDIWKFSLKTHKWTYLGDMPEKLYFHGSAVSPGGSMYLFGGVKEDDNRTNILFQMRLEVPPLQELIWEFICHCNSHLDLVDPNELRSLGIPKEFINRLTQSIPGVASSTLLERYITYIWNELC